jgi:hypothetical protein
MMATPATNESGLDQARRPFRVVNDVNDVNERRPASAVGKPSKTAMDPVIARSPSPVVATSLRWSRGDGPQSKRRRDTCSLNGMCRRSLDGFPSG